MSYAMYYALCALIIMAPHMPWWITKLAAFCFIVAGVAAALAGG